MNLLGILLLTLVAVLHCNAQYHDGFTHRATFGPEAASRDVSVFWTPGEKDSDWLKFEIRAKTTGWMGLGLSPNGAMKGADLVVMWIDKDGVARISDRHGPSSDLNGYPPADEQQDYEIVFANETLGYTLFQIRRRMATCDVNDWKITMGTVRMLFACNDNKPQDPSGNDLAKHTDHFTRSVRLIGPDDSQRVQQIFNSPDIYTTVEFSSGGVNVPGDLDTLYWCRMFELPKFDRPLSIVGFEMLVQPENLKYVHHVLLYGCKGNQSALIGHPQSCYDTEESFMEYCGDVWGGWAVGGEPFAYPDGMGMRWFAEEYDYFAAEFHYDNSDLAQNIHDNSSFKLYLTDKVAKTEIGKLNLGTDSNVWSILIPPQQEDFTQYTYCATDCTANLENNTMTLMSGFLHSHLAGRAIKVRHIRNGIELPPIVSDEYYDFKYQSPIIFPERELKAGDELIVECHYNSMDRNKTTTGGLSTKHEMCLALLEYYPRNKFLEQRCFSVMNRWQLSLELGALAMYSDGNPETTVVTNAQGVNQTFTNWMDTFDWTANGGVYVEILQTWNRVAPHMSVCKINNATNDVDSDFEFMMPRNPSPSVPYAEPKQNCSFNNQDTETTTATTISTTTPTTTTTTTISTTTPTTTTTTPTKNPVIPTTSTNLAPVIDRNTGIVFVVFCYHILYII